MSTTHPVAGLFRAVFQRIAFGLMIALSLGLAGYSIACAFELAPWLELPLGFGDKIYLEAGKYVQIGVSALCLALCFFLPTNARVMALENSHRKFHMGMTDVAKAYALSHRSDRTGVFEMKGEFDSIRERIAFLRDHPELADLEPSVLELASQMSHVSHELATTYSDNKVARARDFLIARQQEIALFNERLENAKVAATEIRQWSEQVEMEEAIARAQLDRLKAELGDILPQLQQAADDNFYPARALAAAQPDPPEVVLEEDDVDMALAADNITILPRAAE
ncbi:DNA repair protein [uncultured Pelagimonas sp.]|uniref:DNA repair protein n=1 Tax=uncultured Pelagimonas sp. TaxID=1618102 RepID=UPI0026292E6D|nr:DNA repair protein [uncultured Pelagimonas sp.]